MTDVLDEVDHAAACFQAIKAVSDALRPLSRSQRVTALDMIAGLYGFRMFARDDPWWQTNVRTEVTRVPGATAP